MAVRRLARLKEENTRSDGWDDYHLDELWIQARDYFGSNDEIHLETRPLFDFIEELLDGAGAICLSGVFDGPPGQSSAQVAFYAENPKKCFENAVVALKRTLSTK